MSISHHNLTLNYKEIFMLAVQGNIDSLWVKSDMHNVSISIGWLHPGVPTFTTCVSEEGTCALNYDFSLNYFPEFPGFGKQTFCKNTFTGSLFLFVKYMDRKIHMHNKIFPAKTCEKQTDMYSAQMFSWRVAKGHCQMVGATQVELINRFDLEEFLHILKLSPDLYPMEAVFIGLKRKPGKMVGYIKTHQIPFPFASDICEQFACLETHKYSVLVSFLHMSFQYQQSWSKDPVSFQVQNTATHSSHSVYTEKVTFFAGVQTVMAGKFKGQIMHVCYESHNIVGKLASQEEKCFLPEVSYLKQGLGDESVKM